MGLFATNLKPEMAFKEVRFAATRCDGESQLFSLHCIEGGVLCWNKLRWRKSTVLFAWQEATARQCIGTA